MYLTELIVDSHPGLQIACSSSKEDRCDLLCAAQQNEGPSCLPRWVIWGGVGGKAEFTEISRLHKRAMQKAAGDKKDMRYWLHRHHQQLRQHDMHCLLVTK